MHYLKSTTQKEYTVQGKVIPRCINEGNKYLVLNAEEFRSISEIPVIASLIKNGFIYVSEKEPSDMRNSTDRLKESNAVLMAKNTQLQEELAALKAGNPDVESLKKEALAEISKRDEALKKAEEEIAALKAKLATE